jgi:hypothetical protein
MPYLLELPIELLHEILEHLRPVNKLPDPMPWIKPDPPDWDIRHWNRTLAAVARTCRLLHVLAIPRLYSNYEAYYKIPIHAFFDRVSSDMALQKGLTSIIIPPSNGPCFAEYKPTHEQKSRCHEWFLEDDSQLKPYGLKYNLPLNADECAQLEIWRLVSHAPNLEIFKMNCRWEAQSLSHLPAEFASHLPPVWLHPITLAASRIHNGLENNGWFEKLHTLKVNLRGNCGSYLALLFRLPSLRRLILWTIQFPLEGRFTDWPESAPISKVHTLGVEYSKVPSCFVVHMIGYCQALQSFSCDQKNDVFLAGERVEEDTKEWCTNIIRALRRHSTTLKRLALEPFHKNPDTGFQYLDWRSFEALEFLVVPSMVFMGRPPGVATNGEWPPIGEWQYPSICDVMPLRLQYLELHMPEPPEPMPRNRGFERFFTSLLPSKLNEDSSRANLGLKRVIMNDLYLEHDRPFPMDFWQVQHAFRNAGSEFEYSVHLDLDESEQLISVPLSASTKFAYRVLVDPRGCCRV